MLHWPKKSLVMPFYYINFDQNGPPYVWDRNLLLRKIFFQSMTQVTGKKKIQVLSVGDEPVTFWLLVQMFNHQVTGDSWELRLLYCC